PGLGGLFAPGGPPGAPYGEKLANGKPINETTIAEWIHIGGTGQIGTMPPMGGMSLSDQDLADLVAFLKTLASSAEPSPTTLPPTAQPTETAQNLSCDWETDWVLQPDQTYLWVGAAT